MDMKKNIEDIKNRIENAKQRSGRVNEDIILIAVSKTQPYEKIIEAKENGLFLFGENKVQELVEKYPMVQGVEWHLIGHLQRNKVKYIIDKADLIHSVDSLALADEINKRAVSIKRVMPILIQINIGMEESKSGISEDEVYSFSESLSKYENIKVMGLMTVPPINQDEEKARQYFRKMKSIFDNVKSLNYKNFDIRYLSMGMTDDFEIAIEEGANIIRIGTGIFGKRVYKEG